ncbi:hypothetical protein DFH27DRAFT_579556 [Peziza echinospora]|nr:hypothetical protein DFH27DRAFT_579556 [Peziza echinospora]
MKLPVTLLLTVTAVAASQVPIAATAIDAIFIESVSYAGSGCPQGTLQYQISPLSSTVAFLYPDLTAIIGPGIPITKTRKNCQTSISLKYPAGYQFLVSSMLFAGHVSLDAGVTALHKVTYYFAGSPLQTSAEVSWEGPLKKNFVSNGELSKEGEEVWSPCGSGEALNINTQVRLSKAGGSGDATGTLALSFGAVDWALGLKWRKC